MRILNRTVLGAQFVLLSPALFFMSAVGITLVLSVHKEPARTAQQIVMWYAARMWTLWLLLIALPLTVLISGCWMLLRSRNVTLPPPTGILKKLAVTKANWAIRLIGATTLTAGAILVIVALHMAVN
jgi:hypothetical protein